MEIKKNVTRNIIILLFLLRIFLINYPEAWGTNDTYLTVVNPTLHEIRFEIYEDDQHMMTVTLDALDGFKIPNSKWQSNRPSLRFEVTRARAEDTLNTRNFINRDKETLKRYFGYFLENLRLSNIDIVDIAYALGWREEIDNFDALKKFINDKALGKDEEEESGMLWEIGKRAIISGGLSAVGSGACYIDQKTGLSSAAIQKSYDWTPQCAKTTFSKTGNFVSGYVRKGNWYLHDSYQKYLNRAHASLHGITEKQYDDWYAMAVYKANEYFTQAYGDSNLFIEDKLGYFGDGPAFLISAGIIENFQSKEMSWVEALIVQEIKDDGAKLLFADESIRSALNSKISSKVGSAIKEGISKKIFENLFDVSKLGEHTIQHSRTNRKVYFTSGTAL